MDRAAKLAAEARECVRMERESGFDVSFARTITRASLAYVAEEYGFAPNEISAAIDEALTAAGATP